MRVLHLFSNHKLTGPAELALDTTRYLHESKLEVDSGPESENGRVQGAFVPGWHPSDPTWVSDLARERGVQLVEEPGLRLSKHFHVLRTPRSAFALRRYLIRENIALIHCHMPNDHLIASLARTIGLAERRVPIVRTVYDGSWDKTGWRQRWTLRKTCDHLIYFSRRLEDALSSGLVEAPRRTLLEPPIDTRRFKPDAELKREGRRSLNIEDHAFVVGIVARMQTHRRFEVLLEAIARAARELEGFRFVIIGRGTNQEKVAREPVRRMGLDSTVVFSGYRSGDDYLAALHSMDAKVFLVPGSDGTCRAVREALACGIPLIAANRGILPEIVRDGESGCVVDDTPENLSRAMIDFARDPEKLESMARTAREEAERRFGYESYVNSILRIYKTVLRASAH